MEDSKSIMEVLRRMEKKQAELSGKVDVILKHSFRGASLQSMGSRGMFTSQPGSGSLNMDSMQGDSEPWDCEAGKAAMKSSLAAPEVEDATLEESERPKQRPSQQMMRRRHTFDEDDFYNKKGEDIADFYGAMGWRKQMQDVFAVKEGADRLTRFAYGPVWAMLSVVMIIANTVVIGVEIQLSTSNGLKQSLHREGNQWPTNAGPPPSNWDGAANFAVLEKVFLAWFVFEVLVNLYAQKKDFFVGPDWYWNAFDGLVVVTAIIMQIYRFANVGFLRVVRLLRLGKMLRAFRVFKFLRGIRSMLISISGSIMHLISAMLLMCLFMYTVALIIMQSIAVETEQGGLLQGITDGTGTNPRDLTVFSAIEDRDTLVQQVYMLYGGVGRTMMTLFMTISGGLEWKQAAWPMVELGWVNAVLWMFYIFFMIFGMLNVLTGIFVDAAFQAMNSDRDNIIQTQIEEKHSLINLIKGVFQTSDTDGSGQVSMDEFQDLLKNHEMVAYLSAIGIDNSEAQGLFRLLDDDGSGSISIDEFVTGVMRLKGSAKSVDMVMLLYENRKISKKLNRIWNEARRCNTNFQSMMVANA